MRARKARWVRTLKRGRFHTLHISARHRLASIHAEIGRPIGQQRHRLKSADKGFGRL